MDGPTTGDRRDPAWFAAVMGTGGVAAVAAQNPGAWSGATAMSRGVGLLLLLGAAVLFVVLAVRAVAGRQLSMAELRSADVGPSYGTLPGAALVLAAASVALLPGVLGTTLGWWAVAVWTAAGALLAVLVTVVLFVGAFEHAAVDAEAISGTWFIPETALLLASFVVSRLAWTGPAAVRPALTVAAMVLLGAGAVLFAFTAAIFMNRLILLPQHASGAASMWIMISPLSVTVLAVDLVAPGAALVAGADIRGAATLLAAMLWGFALWWVLAAGLATWHTRGAVLRGRPSDWGYVFPPAALTIATVVLGRRWGSDLVEALAVVFSAALLVVWGAVAWSAARSGGNGGA
jgi:tellurite resistance protein TehA-like permease